VSAPLHRALAALLGLPDAAALPMDYAVLVEHAPQAALERAWGACARTTRFAHALQALGQSDALAITAALGAWRKHAEVGAMDGPAVIACMANAIRAAVPCPVLPTTTESEVRDGQ